MKKSKRMTAALSKFDKANKYPMEDAIALAIETSKVKFDASVELHFQLGIDPKKGDQQVRGTVILPNGSGKTKRVAAFVEPEYTDVAKAAGADLIADEEDIAKIAQTKEIEFDVAIATPTMMPKLARIAQILGPKGLMPNPKTDTVGMNVEKMVIEQKGGKIAFKNDNTSNVHVLVGKVSFGSDKLQENVHTVLDALKAAKPVSSKGVYLKSSTISTTMGPGIPFIV